MAKPLGFIIDQGLSPIDGSPYVAIMTLNSTNRKTGKMLQIWILRSDLNPVEAIQIGADVSVCGDCPHRKQDDGSRSCYVNVGQAPLSVYKSFKRGRYVSPTSEQLRGAVAGHSVRFGAYGDPAILHGSVVSEIISYADGHTGYTHQWRSDFATQFKNVFQASCDGFNDYFAASTAGWKTFSVVPKGYTPAKIKQCPATVTDSKAQCNTCALCDGAKAHIYVQAHGSGAKYVTALA